MQLRGLENVGKLVALVFKTRFLMESLLRLRRFHVACLAIIDRDLAKMNHQPRQRDPADFDDRDVNLSDSGKKKLRRLIETLGVKSAAIEMGISETAARKWAKKWNLAFRPAPAT